VEAVCRKNKAEFEEMTSREKEVLCLWANGNSSFEIARILGISKNTVVTYRKNIIKKTKLKTPKGIVLFALDFDIL
jgi:DNA-binding CsgD family transcriptional regulator